MKNVNSHKVQRGYYNFAEDSTDGAVSTIDLGSVLPANAIITRFCVDTIITGVPGTGEEVSTTISFGLRTTDGSAISLADGLMLANGAGAFVAGQVLEGKDFNASPIKLAHQNMVTMTIGEIALVAGEFAYTIEYTENTI